ncbi:cupredoxin domain-containing protein [Candidatus Nitrososphaera gargensis Ga9.2]|uniref:Cupredoxin domain-containing protein n=1 Tax=Nitrososphaera gargensis (strain Ga9.2) TaxID=1237085 RepID=K0IMP0_NITGG|nr:plastocyanin/azurin family copper-binding protein [Candidatus Nitrososphaera gargensis]AFU58064.1 cupredoxin domain-containing protein [Candidatus Nitrososphaera gargensis Ga9.2]
MSDDNNSKRSKKVPIIAAIVTGIVLAVATGLIINTTLPRNTFGSDILHPPQSVTIIIPANASIPDANPTFSPKEITVVLGVNNTVVWINQSNSPERVIGEDVNAPGDFGKIRSLIEAGGGTWAFTFTEEGTYNYLSDIHPWLKGTVIVKRGD